MNLFHFIFVILSIYSSTFVKCVRTDEILGCGGFIKSHAEIDFSKVEVKLLTKQGSLRDHTDCSPGNGYYFLPVYDKGDYILKISPPPGWSFEPEQIEISFDGETDICSLGQDVNFSFKGFGITGKVEISGRDGGAKGVDVELKSENKQDVRTTVSDANGIFYFTPVIPGKYTIKVKRDTWHFEHAERTVIVNTGNTELPPKSFVVSGFDVRGKFLLDSQSNIDIQIVLYKKVGSNSVVKCDTTNLPQLSSNNENYATKPVCVATVVNGVYSFSGLGSGQYLVRPYFQRKKVDLFIKPDSIEIDVVKDSLIIPESFEITGFSASGRVLSAANSFGVGNAKVKLNGKEVATTHSDGTYVLANIKAGTYTIQVEADMLQFNDQTVKISTANPIIPDITVAAFKVCGQVVSQQSHTVAITKHSSTFHTQVQSAAQTGEWCVFLPNGRYSAEILTSSDDRIQFFPIQQNIEVSSSPVSGIIFSQLRATVTGSVKCLPDSGANCNDITVTLHSLDSSGKHDGKQSLALLKNGKYSFSEVLPGTYEVTVPTPSSLCWESTTIALNVKSATETIPPFVQIGYRMSVISSHSTKMTYKLNAANQSDQSEEIQLVTGLNQFCVTKFGQYMINFIGCHSYDANVPPFMHTNDVQPAVVTAIKHKNGVRLLSDVNANYKFVVERSNNVQTVDLIADKQKVDGLFVYRHDFDLQLDERIVVKPKNDVMLFKPEKREIVGGSDCLENAFSFYATKGMIINGKINPPISDAVITLKFPDNPALVDLETKSDQSGSFKFGPFDGSLNVELTAFKESYVFSEYDKVNQLFKAHKLCEIIAVVRDEQKNLLPGVLLSLSGAESYRKNLVTSDDGTIKYHSLSPGQYYLRAMMKEYKFEPHSKVIDVADGETINVELSGKRVAYSIFGTVTTLSGEPFPNVLVATTAKEPCEISHQEDATTEKNGNYRIRGLLPGCSYDVHVKSGSTENSNVDRTMPATQTIQIEKVDVRDVNFVAFSPVSFVDVIARVYASNNDYYKSLRIKLYKKGSSDSPIYSQRVESPLNPKSRINPGIMVFFPRIPFDGNTYYVELTTSLSDKHFRYDLPVESFVSNRSSVFIEMEFSPEVRTSENELNQNSLSALLLVGLIAIVFFRQDLAMELLNFVWSRLSALIDNFLAKSKKKENRHDATFDASEIEKLAQSINATKRKSVRKT